MSEEENTSEDRDFSFWLNFFENKKNLTDFVENIQKKDSYFLNHGMALDYDDELYEKIRPYGFMEEDFQYLLYWNKKESEDNDSEKFYYHTRICLALFAGVDFDDIKERFGEKKYLQILETAIVYGEYDLFSVEYEKLIALLIKKGIVPKNSLFDLSFLRGVELGKRNN